MKKKIVVGTLLAVMAFSMIGCSKKEETKATESTIAETETQTPEPETYKAIGTEKEGDKVYCVKLKNSTGHEITGVSIKTTEEAEFPENMLKDGDIYAKGEERNLYYEVVVSENETESTSEGTADENGEKLLTQGYDVQITFDDGTVKVLHSFPFDDIKEGEICFQDEVVFLKYQSVTMSDSEVSTKEAELAILEAEKAEETAATEAAEEYYEENSWDNGGYYEENNVDNGGYVNTPVPEAPAPEAPVPEAPAQSPDECLGGDALTY